MRPFICSPPYGEVQSSLPIPPYKNPPGRRTISEEIDGTYLALHPVEFAGFHYSTPQRGAVLAFCCTFPTRRFRDERRPLAATVPSGARTFLPRDAGATAHPVGLFMIAKRLSVKPGGFF